MLLPTSTELGGSLMSVEVNRVLRLLACVNRVEDELRRSQSEPRDGSARRTAGTAFEALRSAARRGDPNARVALDAFVASLAIKDASRPQHLAQIREVCETD
jgi:predicted NBD/HSP70 family sugar kinase